MNDQQVIPLATLLVEENEDKYRLPSGREPRELLNEADVIVAVDVTTSREVLVYGRRRLQEIVDSGSSDYVAALRIELDLEAGELDKLLHLVEKAKGYHDYQPKRADEPE